MRAVVVHLGSSRHLRTALLPRHPQDESERNRGKDRPRHFRGPSRAGQIGVVARDADGPERGAKNEQLRHEDAGDADDEKHGRKHGGNLTRLASVAWG